MGAVKQSVWRASRPLRRAIAHVRWRARRTTADVVDRFRRGDRTVIVRDPWEAVLVFSTQAEGA